MATLSPAENDVIHDAAATHPQLFRNHLHAAKSYLKFRAQLELLAEGEIGEGLITNLFQVRNIYRAEEARNERRDDR